MSTIQDTDALLVQRNSSLWQATISRLANIQDGDLIAIGRGGVWYQATGAMLMAEALLDTDLLLIGRGGVNYTVSFADVKPFLPVAVGEQTFTIPGTINWVVPAGVRSICLVAVGGGASGTYSSVVTSPGTGGAGGGLVWANNLPVTPGETLSVVVGGRSEGGQTSASTAALEQGKPSSVTRAGAGGWSAIAYGGNTTNTGTVGNYSNAGYGAVTGIASGYGVASGGSGINGSAGTPYGSGGGGGAAGYSRTGGSANTPSTILDGGMGGERGTTIGKAYGGGGGGVGLYGTSLPITTANEYSAGGSGGMNGWQARGTSEGIRNDGGSFGGGGGGGKSATDTAGYGAQGAVRIIWGAGKSFPSNAASDNGNGSVPVFIGSSRTEIATNVRTITPTSLPNAQVGDLVIAIVHGAGGSNHVGSWDNPNVTFLAKYVASPNLAIAYRIHQAGDATSTYTFGTAASCKLALHLLVYRNGAVDPYLIVKAQGQTTGSANVTVDNSVLIAANASDVSGVNLGVTGMTAISTTVMAYGRSSVLFQYVNAGVTGLKTFSSSDQYVMFAITPGNVPLSIPRYITSASTAWTTTDHTVDYPAGTQDGDLVVMLVTNSDGKSITAPGDWTTVIQNSSSGLGYLLASKKVNGETSVFVSSTNALKGNFASILVFRNAKWGATGTSSFASTQGLNAPAFTMPENGIRVVAYGVGQTRSYSEMPDLPVAVDAEGSACDHYIAYGLQAAGSIGAATGKIGTAAAHRDVQFSIVYEAP